MHSVIFILSSFLFFKQKTAYEMRISDWSSDVCSSDLAGPLKSRGRKHRAAEGGVIDVDVAIGLRARRPRRLVGVVVDAVQVNALRTDERHRLLELRARAHGEQEDRKSTRLNSSH